MLKQSELRGIMSWQCLSVHVMRASSTHRIVSHHGHSRMAPSTNQTRVVMPRNKKKKNMISSRNRSAQISNTSKAIRIPSPVAAKSRVPAPVINRQGEAALAVDHHVTFATLTSSRFSRPHPPYTPSSQSPPGGCADCRSVLLLPRRPAPLWDH